MFLDTDNTVGVVITSSIQVVFTTRETINIVRREVDPDLFILHCWFAGERLQRQ